MDNKDTPQGLLSYMDTFEALGFIFVALRLCGQIEWPWPLVITPFFARWLLRTLAAIGDKYEVRRGVMWAWPKSMQGFARNVWVLLLLLLTLNLCQVINIGWGWFAAYILAIMVAFMILAHKE